MADGNLGWPAPESAPLTSQAQHREANCHPRLAWGGSPRCGLYLGPSVWLGRPQLAADSEISTSRRLPVPGLALGLRTRHREALEERSGYYHRPPWKPAAGEEQVRRPRLWAGGAVQRLGAQAWLFTSHSAPPLPLLRFPFVKRGLGQLLPQLSWLCLKRSNQSLASRKQYW